MRACNSDHLGRAGVLITLAGQCEFIRDGSGGLEQVRIVAGVGPNQVAAVLQAELGKDRRPAVNDDASGRGRRRAVEADFSLASGVGPWPLSSTTRSGRSKCTSTRSPAANAGAARHTLAGPHRLRLPVDFHGAEVGPAGHADVEGELVDPFGVTVIRTSPEVGMFASVAMPTTPPFNGSSACEGMKPLR